MQNIILADSDIPSNWKFVNELENTTKLDWRTVKFVNNELRQNYFSGLVKYLKYFYFPLIIFIRRKKYGRILAWQQFYGLMFAFYCRLFHTKKVNELYIMTFIYKSKKGLCGRLYKRFMRYVVSSAYIDAIICFSKSECAYYSELLMIKREKFHYIPLGIEDVLCQYSDDNSSIQYSAEPYLLLAGRSNRDYQFVVDALKGTGWRAIILCDVYTYNGENSNIQCYKGVCGEDYKKLLRHAWCSVIPLKDEHISSGQLVILQSMMFGIPVIITESDTIETYIQNNENGLVIAKKRERLLDALERLKMDQGLYKRLSHNARRSYQERFDEKNMGINVGKIINNTEK
jgi:glycosyltransferase involved in cell wall biosynthesis